MVARPIAVVGGGPAGALVAAALAAAGRPTCVFEERPGWEKPCGGGVTDKALRQFPFLGEDPAPRNWIAGCDLESPAGRRASFALERPIAIFSRATLNGLLLRRAVTAGAQLVPERVVRITPDALGWRLELRGGSAVLADRLVIACGARSGFREQFGPRFSADDWMATAGYYVPNERLPWPAERIQLRFLPGLEGYIWSFPRTDHASVGICGKMTRTPTAALRTQLEAFLRQAGVEPHGMDFYAHLLPAPGLACLASGGWSGGAPKHPWAVVGDAAGLVDPITGEGLYYALQSAHALAQAWSSDGADSYAARLEREILPELRAAAQIAERFFHGKFLGQPVLERMAQFAQRSRRFRHLMCDLFAGAQPYGGLRARLYRNLAPALLEWALPAPPPG